MLAIQAFMPMVPFLESALLHVLAAALLADFAAERDFNSVN
jgi:hypothetical protein